MTKPAKTLKALVAAIVATTLLSSCLNGQDEKYSEWRAQNDAFVASIDTDEYELVVPDWAPQNSAYIKWHNDRSLTANNLVALSNSTVDIKYDVEDINGKRIDSSYNAITGDSVYRSQPNHNILGMWIAMTTMHVGDSATVIVPYPSAYGTKVTSTIEPYSTMIFHMKIKDIKAFEKPMN